MADSIIQGGVFNEGYPESKDYTKDFHTPC